ncbi:asparagine synthase-related protein [Angustibacter sp. Root456]|uniref:asparagine synthase-related protein n=1 Tax=Angustibacter sp. Root456 TaxID=1736539 RepID=UPI00210134DE|nr:asparagine synthase-related protein [Angustibacter sp. Root456]
MPGAYYRPSAFETAASWVHGLLPPPAEPPPAACPRAALEAAILPSLLAGPCFVLFSGGRDSSAVLAVATLLARREGLSDPVPVTQRYPAFPDSDESTWQEQVVRHLELANWVRLDITPEQSDLLGADARAGLRERGVIWPPALQTKGSVLASVGAGSFLGGEGGDEVLGVRRPRPLRTALAGGRPSVGDLRAASASVAPRPLRERRTLARLLRSDMQPWLREDFRRQHFRLVAADQAAEPLDFVGALAWLQRRRGSALAAGNFRRLAAEYASTITQPLLAPAFTAAVARSTHRWGYRSRTEAMAALFGDCLPRAVIERRQKTMFNRAYVGEGSRTFAREWDGSGVDHDLVDAERLRQEWLADVPSAISTVMLQSAWLASQQHAGLAPERPDA